MIRVLDSAGSTLVEWGRQQQQEGQVVCVSREEVLQALNEMKTGKASGLSGLSGLLSEVSLEMIAASRSVGIHVMAEICQSARWI